MNMPTNDKEYNCSYAVVIMWEARQKLNEAKYNYNNWIGGTTLREVNKAQKAYDLAYNEWQYQRMLNGLENTYIPPTECEE